jgi:hypothetical protein
MMFMMTMPPMTSEMPAMATTTAPKLLSILPSRLPKVALESMEKLSGRAGREVAAGAHDGAQLVDDIVHDFAAAAGVRRRYRGCACAP